ncbi:pyruvate dehydrogenase (acetyl-transferring) E1 component subunit alpha [Endozoicomonas sp. SM1973]|uniref:Pyruvate dehydrogenase E1 component subunit alpha n=1 Tax=Spartinivicinus marinus TaxID=2994442 RepID=A0A853IG30_9GAMM|nr:pyruvate dehydrogenase (acetyl-transferring) E1 component subunit alpha [Spartinivicinus marinus]MCX4027329.1 pyruvate dehydrogenase (acetyl-transferring) E1 component subunit alpha [Spartinivicinus marinus]NYZ68447.1 pyruvate dehydrogenase (acetyl-transferring) E1 component subunit alpha [Spartinivicinus marinus]
MSQSSFSQKSISQTKVIIDYVQYLNEHAELTQPLPEWATKPDKLVYYYREMVQARQADQKAIALQRTGQLGTYPSTLGQEAIAVIIGSVMAKDDVFVPYYRDHAAMVIRGMKQADVYRYWGGDERGSANPDCKEDLPYCVPIATQVPHAAGAAAAIKVRGQQRAVLCTCGDGGTSKGDFLESINLAGIWQLPLVFIINNNQWAISVPRRLQCGAPTLAQKGIGAGIPALQVDGNDVIALHEVINQALHRARTGKGATLIEAMSYRLSDHTTADDATRYRNAEELKTGWSKEPIKRLQQYLHSHGWWDEQKEQRLQAQVADHVQQSVDEYLKTPLPPVSDLFTHHYQTAPVSLTEQQMAMEAKVTKGGGHD